ncbi:85/88 kDa calcium-independent phospholipase A2-like isoform X3 [Ruditapes philippinarum]|uniref:85/88 kDa calcium-independent phospholipase A2-like isoform X3 n=1 Tax=Ruditapes philippinarum TaxID=129788 RepID=UPI00295C1169|nr:85/88 kDa calcium-independent phospholipase A2-like isoform X3 [Ruditapes philippinarum]
MSLFKTLVDGMSSGISSVGNIVTASINPYKVQVVKQESYNSLQTELKSEYVKLYKKPGCFECVFSHPGATQKFYSLFRLTKDVEAKTFYKQLNIILSLLVQSSSSLSQDDKIQGVCDTIRDHPTWNCAHVAAYNGFFEAFKNPEIENMINAADSVSGVTPLMAGVIGREKHCVHEMLIHNAQIDMADFKGMTVYHYAVKHLPEVLEFLFDQDKNQVYDWMDEKGQTPLYKACLNPPDVVTGEPPVEKHVIVETLLEGGVDPAISKSNRLPIHVAVTLGETKIIELIIKKHPSQKEAGDKKYNGRPLHWAKTREVTELLCKLGCDVDGLSGTNHAPIMIMLMKNRTDCLMELLCYGALCNIGDSNGDTPLHIAVQQDDIDLVRIFVVFGADVNQKNSTSHSPRHVAAVSKGKNKDVILHMLHVSGAKRCDSSVKGCMAGCSSEGRFNGKPDERCKSLFNLDKMALFDDMLCTAVSCTAKYDNGKGEALLDLADGPTDIGDRILCLDGGGIRGLVLVQLLAALQEAAGVPLKDMFDWIGGTSTGGLLALAIGVGKNISYIRGMYFRLKDEVFKGSRPYDSEPFEMLLKREFGETKVMTDIKTPKLMVTAILADRFPAELHMFRNYQPTLDKPVETKGNNDQFEKIPQPHEQLIWRTARSTGAAPTYFRAFRQYMDGGLISNNPTLDVLTELHEYNTGLKFRRWCAIQKQEKLGGTLQNEPDLVRPLGCVVSLGCGRVPVIPRDYIDVYKPSGIFDAHKVYKGTTALVSLLIDQASVSEGRPVDRARAWCSMINVPFYRFSPQLSEDISLDCTDNKTLITMLWETQCYIIANKSRIEQVAQLLTSSLHCQKSQVQGQNLKGSDLQDTKLHAATSW